MSVQVNSFRAEQGSFKSALAHAQVHEPRPAVLINSAGPRGRRAGQGPPFKSYNKIEREALAVTSTGFLWGHHSASECYGPAAIRTSLLHARVSCRRRTEKQNITNENDEYVGPWSGRTSNVGNRPPFYTSTTYDRGSPTTGAGPQPSPGHRAIWYNRRMPVCTQQSVYTLRRKRVIYVKHAHLP
ncbi:hypothetical protein EVAR_97554_1 [Eumeta japonica]|uniref:Uncharacterized protein n=1 Tax=Eumeta variegata TaxID=151549 RepID=A0A4C1WQZ4_EUMVA|nr:hypothetical protein EVAR_97554_1 [Eumeta japonica]